MAVWLVLYITAWQSAAGSPLHESRPPRHVEPDLSHSNIEMLIPLLFGEQAETRVASHALDHYPLASKHRPSASKQRPPASKHRPTASQYNRDEPFSGIPSEAFTLDEQPPFLSEGTQSKKKDLSRDMDDNVPMSMYLHERRERENRAREARSMKNDLSRGVSSSVPIAIYVREPSDRQNRAREEMAKESATADDLASEVMFYLCGELFDSVESPNSGRIVPGEVSECRECCPHLHAVVGGGRGAGQTRGSLSLFGPVGGRRDWMVLQEKFPGMMQHYINTGK